MLLETSLYSLFTVMVAIALPATAAPQPITKSSTSELSLTAKLRLADSATERYNLLPKDEDFVFKFSEKEPVASTQNFPALVGVGASFSVGDLPGCSMSFLHLHPRATELLTVTKGRVLTEMVPEAVVDSKGNQRVIRAKLKPGMVTVFPAGSFHTQVNPDCDTASFVAAFNNEEFSVGLVAQQAFALSDDVIAGNLGQSIAGEDIEKVRKAIPKSAAIEVEKCLAKCGKKKN